MSRWTPLAPEADLRDWKVRLGDEPGLPTETLTRMHREMWTIRRFDEAVIDAWRRGIFGGTTHPYIGMEAGATGVIGALRDDDYVVSYYRGHGHALIKGMDPNTLLAEIIARADGCCRGKGGTMHVADLARGHLGANGVVGAGIPIAVGAALGARVLGQDRLAVAFFGEGASNEGAFHEALNLAAVWKLPVLFVCENNGHSLTTRAERAIAVRDVVARAVGYGIRGYRVDGQDIAAVHTAALDAVEHARGGGGPVLMELKTYRYRTHSTGDLREYRSEEERAPWLQRDPIALVAAELGARGLTDEDLAASRAQAEAIVDAAIAFAEASPLPDASVALEDVYA